MAEERYILTLTPDQSRIVQTACEFYARIMLGQFQELTHAVMTPQVGRDDYCKTCELMNQLLQVVRCMAYPELRTGASYGVGAQRFKDADKAFNVYQALRYVMAWHEHPEGGVTVNFNKPFDIQGVGIPKCEVRE